MSDIMQNVVDVLVNLFILPLQLVLAPIDLLLQQIPGVDAIPAAIRSLVGVVGAMPETLVHLSGVNPVLWNALFLTFVLYFTLAPSINIFKKVWAWVRP